MEWQPIETAPKDGTLIDLYSDRANDGRLPDCKFINGGWVYWTEYGEWEYHQHFEPVPKNFIPTHWMHLPESPRSDIRVCSWGPK